MGRSGKKHAEKAGFLRMLLPLDFPCDFAPGKIAGASTPIF